MKITKRSVVSVEGATARLDVLAHRYEIVSPRYDEAESDQMSEFDALKWTSLCAQRAALKQREREAATCDSPAPLFFRNLGEMQTSVKPENAEGRELGLAA